MLFGLVILRSAFVDPSLWLRFRAKNWDRIGNGLETDLERRWNGPTSYKGKSRGESLT